MNVKEYERSQYLIENTGRRVQFVRKQTQGDRKIACQACRLDPANDSSVIYPLRPTSRLPEFGPFECGPPRMRKP